MSPQTDDPRLTACALGEPLPERDRQEVQQLLADLPDAREAVDTVRALERDLRAAFQAERTQVPASREIANIIEFSAPHAAQRQTPWTTHLLRIAAMLAVSAAIVAVGMLSWAGNSRQPTLARTSQPVAWPEPDEEMPPPDQVMLSVPREDKQDSSYARVRRAAVAGTLPQKDSIRIAELVNHFSYRLDHPDADAPLNVRMEVASAPWQPRHRLVRIYVKAHEHAGDPGAIVARNLSVAVSFNPGQVAAYRRIGSDSPDAREVAAGFAATELYEVIPSDSPAGDLAAGWQRPTPANDPEGRTLVGLTMRFQPASNREAVTRQYHLSH